MSRHAPWFPWYPKDYSSDALVLAMTDLQDLAYRRLIDASWELGPLPSDPTHLARLAKMDEDFFVREIWKYPLSDCWAARNDTRLIQFRLEEEREKAMKRSISARRAVKEREKKRRNMKRRKGKSAAIGRSSGDVNPIIDGPSARELPTPTPTPTLTKQDLLSPVTTKPVSNVVASSEKSELAPNPFHFVVYWKDATANNDFALRVEPRGAFLEFVALEARRLEIRMSGADLERFFRRSETRFLATYSKRVGRNGKARGNAIGPKRLTEELVGWIRSDLANMGNRQAQGGSKSRAQRIDDQVQRRLHSGKQGNS